MWHSLCLYASVNAIASDKLYNNYIDRIESGIVYRTTKMTKISLMT